MNMKISIAIQSGMGRGMGNMIIGTLGTNITSVPQRAKMAPEAPIPIENGGARRTKRRFPAIPPMK